MNGPAQLQKNYDLDSEDLANIYQMLDSTKGDLHQRCEQYAAWTIPAVCPEDLEGTTEQRKGNVEIGARLVNHLANRIADTMFPSDKPFFNVSPTAEAQVKLAEELQAAGAFDGQDKEQVKAAVHSQILKAVTNLEGVAMAGINLTSYIPRAIEALKHIIVTGNAIMHRDDEDKRSVYGIKSHVIVRSLKGDAYYIILRDKKRFRNLTPDIQEKLRASHSEVTSMTEVTLYTRYVLKGDKVKVWHCDQAVDSLYMPDTKRKFSEDDFPCTPLVWNLFSGENYGRGLVEDHSVLFNNLDNVAVAQIDLIGIAADLKFLVAPEAATEPDEYNAAPRGSYLLGRKDDVSTPDYTPRVELEIISQVIDAWERKLSQAFLYNTSAIRDAERVTAEEIRMFARELESAFGGLYSGLALGWQYKEAKYLLSKVDFKDQSEGIRAFDIKIVTGLEKLSREGKIDNLRLAISDLAMLQAVPEEVRAVMDPIKFAMHVFSLRGVQLDAFLLTPEQLEKKRADQAAQQRQLMSDEAGAKASAQAGANAAKETR